MNYKKEEMEAMGRKFEGKKNKEDFWYYITTITEKEFYVDQELLKEYFPIETVTKGLMNIYQTLLGLTFTKVEEGAKVCQIQPGSLDKYGLMQKAVAGMVCNFPKPTTERPSLLSHAQVKKFFHEFGYIMHGIASRTNTSSLFGTTVDGDCVEGPSQMLEIWVWEEESLKLMSSHYKTKDPLPQDLIKKLIASKASFAGTHALRQLFFATYDMNLHTRGQADTVAIGAKMYKDLFGIDRIVAGNIGATLGPRHMGATLDIFGVRCLAKTCSRPGR